MTHICLNMLVKNSGAVLRRSLESALPFIDSYVIVDSSSTDNTLDEITRALGHLPGEVHGTCLEGLSDGFAALRNLNLEKTRSFLCQVDDAYVLWLDAGRQLAGALCPDLHADGYTADVVVNGGAYGFPRTHLFKARSSWTWKYRAHETLVGGNASVPSGLEVHEWREGPTDREKYIRAARLSELDMIDHDGDPRVVFYAAQNWFDAGEYQNALDRYALRSGMAGYWDEIWYSAMREGMCFELLGDTVSAAQCYEEAHELVPHRAEPCRHLARMLSSQFWTDVADRIPWPGTGFLLERNAYQ